MIRVVRAGTLWAFVAASTIACGGGGDGGNGPTTTIDITGRVERSNEVTLQMMVEGVPASMASATVTFNPASSAELVAPDRARLLVAGSLTITIEDENGVTAVRTITVAVPPLIVYDLARGGNRDIWVIALDGLDAVRLTTHAGDDQQPTAAGTKVVFVSYRDGNAELYTRLLTGTAAETRITTSSASETEPALSNDGQRLAYISDVTSYGRVWVATAAGASAAQPSVSFTQPGSVESAPAWRSDGLLSFVSSTNGSADVYTTAAPGTPVLEVGGDFADVEPAWNSAGQRLVFASTRDGDTELYVHERTGGGITRLTTRSGEDGRPSWTPDGRIVFLAWEGGTPVLRWVDPAAPTVVHDIDVGAGTLRYASTVR